MRHPSARHELSREFHGFVALNRGREDADNSRGVIRAYNTRSKEDKKHGAGSCATRSSSTMTMTSLAFPSSHRATRHSRMYPKVVTGFRKNRRRLSTRGSARGRRNAEKLKRQLHGRGRDYPKCHSSELSDRATRAGNYRLSARSYRMQISHGSCGCLFGATARSILLHRRPSSRRRSK